MSKLELAQAVIKDSIDSFQASIPYRAGAALAYRGIFAMPPVLFVSLLVVGIFFGKQVAMNEVTITLERLLGSEATQFIVSNATSATKRFPTNHTLIILTTVGVLLYAATNMFRELKIALNSIWGIQPEPKITIISEIKGRLIGLTVYFAVGFFFLALTTINVILSKLDAYMDLGHPLYLVQGFGSIASFGVLTMLFAIIYKLTPDVSLAWGDVWIGSAVTALLFMIGVWGLGIYLSISTVGSAFGSAEALIVILVWIYTSAQVFLAGAAFTCAYASNVGSRRNIASP